MLDLPLGDIGRPLKDLELSYKPLDVRTSTPIDRVYLERRPFSTPAVEFPNPDGSSKLFDVFVSPPSMTTSRQSARA